MGVKHSKQSVDISSTPKKPGAPVEEINGKTVEEKVEETKVRFPHHLCNFMLSLIQKFLTEFCYFALIYIYDFFYLKSLMEMLKNQTV